MTGIRRKSKTQCAVEATLFFVCAVLALVLLSEWAGLVAIVVAALVIASIF